MTNRTLWGLLDVALSAYNREVAGSNHWLTRLTHIQSRDKAWNYSARAKSTAATACRYAVGNIGTCKSAGPISSSISVHPAITP
jgi:hypothetical protein